MSVLLPLLYLVSVWPEATPLLPSPSAQFVLGFPHSTEQCFVPFPLLVVFFFMGKVSTRPFAHRALSPTARPLRFSARISQPGTTSLFICPHATSFPAPLNSFNARALVGVLYPFFLLSPREKHLSRFRITFRAKFASLSQTHLKIF